MAFVGPSLAVPADRRQRARQLHGLLALALLAVCLTSLAVGASGTSLWRAVWALLTGQGVSAAEAVILWDIRAPRTLLGACVGAALAVSGAVMQGLFRNPLADPGLLGVSAGAGLGALMAIVAAGSLPFGLAAYVGDALLPVMAFTGAWASMMLLYAVATRSGRTSVATMLLAGIALAALTGALSGLLIFHADDMQLRELTFWQLGSLAGSAWPKVLIAGPVILLATLLATTLARGLNGLALGEAAAHHIGIDVQRTKNIAILAVSAATGAAVAVSGGIGFIGIVVPHLLRLATGPDHHGLLINSALLGASLLLGADIVSRLIVAPAELPIGIVTAVLGAPFFLWILLRRRSVVDL
ncbi:FecCD family ABC transporter permease [Roseobacter sinensis]|uniref:Iron chelate uptake ABC transporter family permease subunit n=1 Tax=Roseobacter sinensis TaxID=2931391 RepID=A0ABT3BLL2_9RHOB|nr:iron chelate uptake ABC transporter family permease subunit [Roseobacter sp. WL0113]MCV3274004.1 iron chelate uptake ABC transporter family permease subunit [Roseobacter sp. WL0113]